MSNYGDPIIKTSNISRITERIRLCVCFFQHSVCHEMKVNVLFLMYIDKYIYIVVKTR